MTIPAAEQAAILKANRAILGGKRASTRAQRAGVTKLHSLEGMENDSHQSTLGNLGVSEPV